MKKCYFVMLAALLVAFTACEEEPAPPEQETTTEENTSNNENVENTEDETQTGKPTNFLTEYFTANAAFSNAFDQAGNATAATVAGAKAIQRTAGEGTTSNVATPNIDWTPKDNTWPKTITVDYGTKNVMGADGRTHRGKMTVVASGMYTSEGTELTVTFDNWYVSGMKVEGTQKIKNIGRNNDNFCVFEVEVSNGKLSNDTMSFAFAEKTTRTWTVGEGSDNATTHTYSIVGEQHGTTSEEIGYNIKIENATPMVVNVGTMFPTSGSLTTTVAKETLKTLLPEEYAQMVDLILMGKEEFTFQFIFEGDNKAHIEFSIFNPSTLTEEVKTIESFDLLEFTY